MRAISTRIVARNRQRFQNTLLRWYRRNRRPLPWRMTDDPYAILISEIMLQQTQVDRVIPKFKSFLRRFPSFQHLARAEQRSVVRLWSGLGYNNRAVRLHRLARIIVRKNRGVLPTSIAELEHLPGIGPYTAHAIAAFAFKKRISAVDTNHRRVVTRYFFGDQPAPSKLEHFADALLPVRDAFSWNHALMDFGALICRSRPLCEQCPLRLTCRAYPEVLKKGRTRGTRSKPFLGSSRYLRGRIVEILRFLKPGKLVSLDHLRAKISPQESLIRFQRIVWNLERDGVITVSGRGRTMKVDLR